MSSQVKFVQNQNNFLHGVRGVIFIDGDVAGAVQDISATESGEEDVVYVTLGGLVVCREQMTGRIRWRRHLPGQAWCRSALLVAAALAASLVMIVGMVEKFTLRKMGQVAR